MPSKSKISTIEKVSSLIILVVLGVVFLLVFHFQSHFNPADLGLVPLAAETAETSETPFDLQAVVPEGWTFLGKSEQYNEQTLYEKIDGKAPLYLESGFVNLYTQKIVDSENTDNWAEIYVYDMANNENAFSVYSVQRRSDVHSIEGLNTGYYAGNAGFAAIGQYYLEIIGSNASEGIVSAVKKLAANFNALSGSEGQSSEPSFVKLFPAENLLVDTIALTKNDAFGFSLFKDTYIAQYEVDGEIVTAFVIVCDDVDKASQLSDSYSSFLLENGLTKADTKILGGVYEYSGMYEIVFSEGRFVGGIHESFNRPVAEQIAEKMMENFERNLADGDK